MQAPSDRHFIHGSIFFLANRIQAIQDRITNLVSVKQWFVLLAASQLEASQPEAPNIMQIARDVGASRQNTAKLLEQLEKKGLVRLGPCENDRRSRAVRLTPEARPEMARISKVGGVFVQQILQGVPDEDVAVARRVLEAINANLQQMEERGKTK